MPEPGWYTDLLARVCLLPAPLREYGLEQCAEAWTTFEATGDTRIPFQLAEEIESLEFGHGQIMALSTGQRAEALRQARFYLRI